MDPKVEAEMIAMGRSFFETEYVKRMRSRFIVCDVDVPNPKYVRVGRAYDGGYVMFDDFSKVKVAYSGGINDDVSWDEDMAKRDIDIFMYDHTIDKLPKSIPRFPNMEQNNPRFHWSKTGLTGRYDPKRPELETLPRLIEKNGHADDYEMILKMDIEGAEYDVFESIDEDTLEHFSQIVMEFHSLLNGQLENKIEMSLDKLNATHQLVHVHGNNHSASIVRGGLVLPITIEGTYLRRSDHKFVKSRRFFPTALDMPCHPFQPEISLGYWGGGAVRD